MSLVVNGMQQKLEKPERSRTMNPRTEPVRWAQLIQTILTFAVAMGAIALVAQERLP